MNNKQWKRVEEILNERYELSRMIYFSSPFCEIEGQNPNMMS